MTSPPTENANAMTSPGTSSATTKSFQDLSYMHRPPAIMPNYGKKYGTGLKLKTNVPRVLLYDNVTQQTILDVQLSGLESQQCKISREFEMHIRSFQQQRQFRDKALKNLTKVHHSDDYEEFEREFYSNLDNNDNSFLPSISLSNGSALKNKRKRKNKKTLSASFNAHDKQHYSPQINGFSEIESETPRKNSNTLPAIDTASTPSLVSAKGQDLEVTSTQHFEPKRRVGFRVEKSSSGVTRIFHALPTGDQADSSNEPTLQNGENSQENPEKETGDASEPDISNTSVPMDTSASEAENVLLTEDPGHSQGHGHAADQVMENADVSTGGKREPLLDRRFEMLRRLLIPQEPPNEGYTELSPSFPRRYPNMSALDEFGRIPVARGRKRKKKKGKRKLGDLQNCLSDDDTSSLSDEHSSDSEDEENPNASEARANSGLIRLGQF